MTRRLLPIGLQTFRETREGDYYTDSATARAMRDGLRNLYSVIKGADADLRFAFLTGVSKFSKVSWNSSSRPSSPALVWI